MPHQPAYMYVQDMDKKKDCYTPLCIYDEEYGYYNEPNLAPMGKEKAGTLPQPAKQMATPFKLGK